MLYRKITDSTLQLSSIDVLNSAGNVWVKDQKQRALMTLACRDTDYLPKVKDAGMTKVVDGVTVQVMHNGLYVKKGGYQGQWQAQTIEELKGNHEPQEERVFYETLKRVKPGGIMMELGAWWSYYSMWFVKNTKNSKAICIEPDPRNLELGTANAKLNHIAIDKQIFFCNAAIGKKDGSINDFITEDGKIIEIPIRSVDSLVSEYKVNHLEVLHLDIQGFELEALKGALKTIEADKIRFLFVSTHHYAISGDPVLHERCLEFITSHGGHIIAKHTINESCSGDGLIVASFADEDADFHVDISLQSTDDSLFRTPEIDVAILWDAHNKMLEKTNEDNFVTRQASIAMEKEIELKQQYINHLEGVINDITPLRRHAKRQVKNRLKKTHRRIIQKLGSGKKYQPATTTSKNNLLEAAHQIDDANFASYNNSAKDTVALSMYLSATRLAMNSAVKIKGFRKR